jgi:hypothetical protein
MRPQALWANSEIVEICQDLTKFVGSHLCNFLNRVEALIGIQLVHFIELVKTKIFEFHSPPEIFWSLKTSVSQMLPISGVM